MNFTEILKIIMLGVIEGITEWLPVSSTGHLILFDAFFPLRQSSDFKEMFNVVVQLGAVLAVAVLFFKKLCPFRKQNSGGFVKKETLSLWGKVLLACIPAGVVGVLFDDFFEENLHTPLVIALTLIFYGAAFLFVEARNQKRDFRIQTTEEIDCKTAF